MAFRHGALEMPARFRDELVGGPFRRFVHVREFEDAGGEVVVRDQLDVELP